MKPDRGEIYVGDQKIEGVSSHFAYMPQEDLLLPWKTLLDNVTLYGKIHHKQKEAKQKALSEMETFGLKGYEYAYPHELSGGMRQRAAFLRTAFISSTDGSSPSRYIIIRSSSNSQIFSTNSVL